MLTDLLAALAVVVNGIPQGLLALMYGFAALPTALAFLIGAGGSLYFNSVATISFQAETITLAGSMGKDVRERLSMVFWGWMWGPAGMLMAVPLTVCVKVGLAHHPRTAPLSKLLES